MTLPRAPRWALVAALAASVALSGYGLAWGVPDRWNVDEQVGKSLRLLAAGSPLAVVDPAHPQLYNFVLASALGAYLAVRVAAGMPMDGLAGVSSWLGLTLRDPSLAAQLTLVGRGLSVLLGFASLWLLFRIGCRLTGPRAAAWAVACWAVSLGFIETHHVAKHTPLVVLLVLAVWLACLRCHEAPTLRRWAAAWALGGLAVTAKLDGAIALIPLTGLVWLLRRPAAARPAVWGAWAFGAFAGGLAAGWPALFTGQWHAYASAADQVFIGSLPDVSAESAGRLLARAGEILKQLGMMFSPYLAWVAAAGVLTWRRTAASPWWRVAALFLASYGAVAVGFYLRYEGAHTKWLIHAMPWLSLLAGAWMARAWDRPGAWQRAVVLASLALAAGYTWRADAVFAAGDSRYRSTRWLVDAVPAGTTVEYFQELDLVFASSVLRAHDVIHYGRRSQPDVPAGFAQPVDPQARQAYEARLRRDGPASQLLVVAVGSDFLGPAPAEDAPFLYEVLAGRLPAYQLAQEFSCPESFWWSPRPAYTCPVIRIYQRAPSVLASALGEGLQ